MASSINASTTAGLVNTADTSGVLNIQTAGVTAISIDASQAVSFTNSPTVTGGTANGVAYLNGSKVLTTGSALVFDGSNLGVGVTPSAWQSGIKVLQIGSYSSLGFDSANSTFLGNNWTYSSATYKYINNGPATYYTQTGTGQHQWFNAASGTAGNAITFTQAMTLDASGNLLVGTTGITGGLNGNVINLFGSGTVRNIVQTTGQYSVVNMGSGGTSTSPATTGYLLTDSSANTFGVYTGSSTPLLFGTGGTERARIDSSGNLLVGTTNSSGTVGAGFKVLGGRPIVVNVESTNGGATVYEAYSTGAAAYRFYVGMGGTVYATSTTITAISDQRLKENIRDLDDGLASVMALKPRKFDWKEGKGQDIKDARGFIAQEFETVFPDMIDEWRDPAPEGEEPYKAINANLIPTLVKAIQEQQALITQLQADVALLKGA